MNVKITKFNCRSGHLVALSRPVRQFPETSNPEIDPKGPSPFRKYGKIQSEGFEKYLIGLYETWEQFYRIIITVNCTKKLDQFAIIKKMPNCQAFGAFDRRMIDENET